MIPSQQILFEILGSDDRYLWEYYGRGLLRKIYAWIFRSRIKVLTAFMKQMELKPKTILDVGCGSMLISYALTNNSNGEYVGVDVISSVSLKKYRDAMRIVGAKVIEVVRASAEHLPFRNGVFDFCLSLDVLEHLHKPKGAVIEIYSILKGDGIVALSLPLENVFQKLLRIGFIFVKISGDLRLKKMNILINKTPEYHYVGCIKTYDDMMKMLKGFLQLTYSKYTPIGFYRSINVNAVCIFRK
jgi:ubiquinone/menaquinone biosynthesis C-methylase UbiE